MKTILLDIIIVTSLITFIYPIIMSFIWLLGGAIYKYRTRKQKFSFEIDEQYFQIIIPIFNEGENIVKYIEQNMNLNYTNYSIILIDDCSTDDSYKYIKELLKQFPNLIIHKMEKNTGKAGVLNYAMANLITSEYFICVDSDAVLEKNALKILNAKLTESKVKYTAITGYPNLLNTADDIIHISQQVEYRSIIGMIKRAQSVFGRIMTVSGVCTAYNKNDIIEIGGFDIFNATEDIEITWRIQSNELKALFLPEMIVKMYSPNYVSELLTQRARWTQGGLQTFWKYKRILLHRKNTMMKLFLLEACLSTIWTISLVVSSIGVGFMAFMNYPGSVSMMHLVYVYLIMFSVSLIYLIGAYILDNGKKESLWQFIKVLFYFPFIYWFIYPLGYLMGFIRTIKGIIIKDSGATWRGTRKGEDNNMRLRTRYIFSIVIDALFLAIIFEILSSIFLLILAPVIKGNSIALIVAGCFILLFIFIFVYYLCTYPYKNGATFGEKLLAIRRVRHNNKKLLFIQTMAHPIFLIFLFFLSFRILYFVEIVQAFIQNDISRFYMLYTQLTAYANSSVYQVLAIMIFIIFDIFAWNLLDRLFRVKVIRGKASGEEL